MTSVVLRSAASGNVLLELPEVTSCSKLIRTAREAGIFSGARFRLLAGDVQLCCEDDLPDESDGVVELAAAALPQLPVALLFPGLWPERNGMLQDCDLPEVTDLLQRADALLGWSVRDMCLNITAQQLAEPRCVQPAMFLAGLIAREKLGAMKPDTAFHPQAVAGLGCSGVWAAIYAAGVLDFEDTLKLVHCQATLLQDAIEAKPQASCSIAGLDRDTVERLCAEAKSLYPPRETFHYSWDQHQVQPLSQHLEERRRCLDADISDDVWHASFSVKDNIGVELDIRYSLFEMQFPLQVTCPSIGKPVEDPVCQISGSLFPSGFICAGERSCVDSLTNLALQRGALAAKTLQANALHTPLMQCAEDHLAKALDEVLPRMRPPRCYIYLTQGGHRIAPGTSTLELIPLLKDLTSEIMWESAVKRMIADGLEDFYDLGPSRQLKAMMKRIDRDSWIRTQHVSM
eukprot:TRINITY_DN67233_c0_g1_i1.p1 TRINITY_DN67233_c0_g1~~TRINITY_DN67233_c0_g1_i1.p1  ORF type:complete len:459 (+),score=80.20 TRINITY_DN67233_c0_g1_i1:65-1441(+)